MDSPLFAGRYVTRVDLDTSGPAPVRLNVFADRTDLLEAKPEHLEAHCALVTQAYRLFNSHHYDHYDFLLALSDRMGGVGLEHHRSSENGTIPAYFTEWDKNPDTRELLPHEYAHSWNGKFRVSRDEALHLLLGKLDLLDLLRSRHAHGGGPVQIGPHLPIVVAPGMTAASPRSILRIARELL